MPDYSKYRDLVSHRVELEFDTGARVVGYVAACKPSQGTVQLVNLTKVKLLDAAGQLIEEHDALSVVPNVLTGVRVAEGPEGR